MSAEKNSTKNKKPLNTGDKMLLIPAMALLLFSVMIFGWYGYTYIPVRQSSAIRPQTVEVGSGGVRCTLDIPAGTLTISHPSHAALGSSYKMKAEIRLERPLRFTDCSSLPNWNLGLEGQSTLVASDVRPYASIRQPAFNRENFDFEWTFIPEEPVLAYGSHFWLRAVISQGDDIIERWNMLVRDFLMENTALFGQPTILWLISAGTAALIAILLLILLKQRKVRS